MGGLVGYNYEGDIEQSFATGEIEGAIGGGLVGINGNTQAGIGTVKECYATGAILLRRYRGGLVGDDDGGVISQCYSTGIVHGGKEAGGFAGTAEYQYQFGNLYWDMTTSGRKKGTSRGDVEGLTGLTDAQLKSALPAGFDPAVWGESPNINNGYPYILANPPPNGNKAIKRRHAGAKHAH